VGRMPLKCADGHLRQRRLKCADAPRRAEEMKVRIQAFG
jgi:hypothetical protein